MRLAQAFWADVRQTRLQIVVVVMGLWWTSNGPIAYAINPSFSMHPMKSCTWWLLGFVPVTVNAWHALFHFVTGLTALAVARHYRPALAYSLICGTLYFAVAGLGLGGGDNVLGMMAVDTFGNLIHLIEGAIITTAALTALSVTLRGRRTAREDQS